MAAATASAVSAKYKWLVLLTDQAECCHDNMHIATKITTDAGVSSAAGGADESGNHKSAGQ